MADDFTLLGPAEQHVAKTLGRNVAEATKALALIQEELERLAVIDFEEVMLDGERKEMAVKLADIFAALPARMADIGLMVMIASVSLQSKDEATR